MKKSTFEFYIHKLICTSWWNISWKPLIKIMIWIIFIFWFYLVAVFWSTSCFISVLNRLDKAGSKTTKKQNGAWSAHHYFCGGGGSSITRCFGRNSSIRKRDTWAGGMRHNNRCSVPCKISLTSFTSLAWRIGQSAGRGSFVSLSEEAVQMRLTACQTTWWHRRKHGSINNAWRSDRLVGRRPTYQAWLKQICYWMKGYI